MLELPTFEKGLTKIKDDEIWDELMPLNLKIIQIYNDIETLENTNL